MQHILRDLLFYVPMIHNKNAWSKLYGVIATQLRTVISSWFITPVKHLNNATGYIHIDNQTPARNIKVIVETYEPLTCWYGILNSEADIVSLV